MRAKLVCLLILLTPIQFLGQAGGTIAVHAGAPGNIYSFPATMDLIPKSADAHPGKIWVRSTDEGLHIWGKVEVNINDLHWPHKKSEMLASDHVEIWLSTTTDVKMPPIGYGNQFGETDLKTVADCGPMENGDGPGTPPVPDVKSCERWFNDQVAYRKLFERLFTRQWLAASGGYSGRSKSFFEDYASTAWAGLNAAIFEDELPKALEPRGSDGIVSEFSEQSSKHETKTSPGGVTENKGIVTGYNFHFFIPWSAFPPAQQLNLHDLWLMVDVFGAAPEGKKMGALSTTSAQRAWGKPSRFNHLVLDAARNHEITPCGAADTEKNMYGTAYPIWYFPMAGKGPLNVSKVYDVENPAGGYMYDPGGVSPIIKETDHFWKTLADGAAVCGPELSDRKGAVTKNSNFEIEKTYFATKTLNDGWTLVRTGPDMSTQSRFGSGQCGSCPVVDFHVYAVSPQGDISAALDINDEFSGMEGRASDGDFAIAPDWTRVTFYEDVTTDIDNGKAENDDWTATSYCLQGHAYNKCGEEKNAKPPSPPNFKLDD